MLQNVRVSAQAVGGGVGVGVVQCTRCGGAAAVPKVRVQRAD